MKIETAGGQEVAVTVKGIRFKCGGYNTMVNCGGDRTFKVVTGLRPGGRNYVMSEARANKVKVWLDQYALRLPGLGVKIPETKTEIISGGNRFAVLITQDNLGNDLSKTIGGKTRRQVAALAKQIREGFIDKLLAAGNFRTDGHLRVGADLKANNFCGNGQGCLYLVDTFPPHMWIDGENGDSGPIVEMFETPDEVRQVGVWKLFTPEGTLVNTLTQLGGVAIQHWEIFKEELDFPKRLLEVDASDLSPKDVYTARLLACEYGWQRRVGQNAIRAFFERTHFESMMAEKQMDAIKAELQRMRG